MSLFWMGVILVIVLAYLAASTVLILLRRRSSMRKMEAALVQLQNELIRVNSLLEETRARILGAESDVDARIGPGDQAHVRASDRKD